MKTISDWKTDQAHSTRMWNVIPEAFRRHQLIPAANSYCLLMTHVLVTVTFAWSISFVAPAAHRTIPSFQSTGAVFSRSLSQPPARGARRSQATRRITNGIGWQSSSGALWHRSTKARGREARHTKSSWPDRYRPHGAVTRIRTKS